jgi:hypothetical protein
MTARADDVNSNVDRLLASGYGQNLVDFEDHMENSENDFRNLDVLKLSK